MGPPAYADGDLRGSVDGRPSPRLASMGPPAYADGDDGQKLLRKQSPELLQGGRRPTPTETVLVLRRLLDDVELQWGRRPTPTETKTGRWPATPAAELQWGRRPTPTETRRAPVSRVYTSPGFNGAAGLRRRRRWPSP